mgnify:CR=1 FL=1|jgi:hypothetical protein|tara:strand:+ start:675 stop:827 length:153 start_codon:yes stop_codon:yes gene_type:complete
MTDDRGPLDLEKQIEELKKDNLYLAKEIDRLNEYIQEMELENVGKEKRKR